MSQEFLNHYSAFQRHILGEFMSQDELNDLDTKYNQAKKQRQQRREQEKFVEDIQISVL